MSQVTHNQFFYRFVMRHAIKVISLTDAMAQDMINNFRLCDNKSIVIPPVIRNEFFDAEISDTRDENKILFIGRLSVEKNVQDLISSFATLSNKNNNLKLVIVGDGEQGQQIESMAKSMNISEHIEFLGFQSNTINYLKTAGCLVLCSHYEGFPLVFIESLAMGVPVVTYNFPAGPDTIIKDGKNGFIVPHYDVSGLADAIQKALQLKISPTDIRKSVMGFHPDIIHQKFIEVASKF